MKKLLFILCLMLALPASAQVTYRLGANSVGLWAVLWLDDGYALHEYDYGVRWEALTDGLRSDLIALANDPEPIGKLSGLVEKHKTLERSDPKYKEIFAPALAEIASYRPKPIVWKVAKNGTATTRPAYAFLNGQKAMSSSARIAVGAPCDPAVRFVEGKSVYAWVGPDLVAICRREE